MKNVFLLPTDKPSRIYLIKSNNRLGLTSTNPEYMENFGSGTQNQHIYITSDEEIKDCFVINTHTNQVYFLEGYYGMQPRTKKIILTTDQDLIDLGVQSIDDEFLEWFVKNPSCESVEVSEDYFKPSNIVYGYDTEPYKIILPKKETKQETTADYIDRHIVEAMVEVAKQKMYSEEEVINIIYKIYDEMGISISLEDVLKQFKK